MTGSRADDPDESKNRCGCKVWCDPFSSFFKYVSFERKCFEDIIFEFAYAHFLHLFPREELTSNTFLLCVLPLRATSFLEPAEGELFTFIDKYELCGCSHIYVI